jgi:hypothetical protein
MVAVLMDVHRMMRSVALNVPVKFEEDTAEIMYAERFHHLILEMSNQAPVTTNMEIINIQINCHNDYATFMIIKHKQSSING